MITHTAQPISKASIFLTCSEEKYYSSDFIVQKNTLIRMLSGEMRIILPGSTLVLTAGDVVFFPRLELAKVMKLPKDGRPYQSVAIYFTPEAVQHYFVKHHLKPGANLVKTGIRQLQPHPLLESLFNSLLPYFDLEN